MFPFDVDCAFSVAVLALEVGERVGSCHPAWVYRCQGVGVRFQVLGPLPR